MAHVLCQPYVVARSILGNDFILPEEIATARGVTYTDEQATKFWDTLPAPKALEWCRDNRMMLHAGPPTQSPIPTTPVVSAIPATPSATPTEDKGSPQTPTPAAAPGTSWFTGGNIFWAVVVLLLVAIGLSWPKSLYKTTAILNGTLFGAIGGALGAVLEFVIKKRWGRTAATLGAVVGFIAGQSVEHGVNFAGDKVYENVVRPKVDRAVIEQRLLADPKMRWLSVLRENEPKTYAGYIEAIISRARSGEPLEDTINHVRKTFIEPLFVARAPHLSDATMVRYIQLVADQMEMFGKKNPRLCVLALRNEPLGDIRPYVTDTLVAQEVQLLEDALLADITQVRPRYSQEEQEKVIEALVMKMAREHGELVQLLAPDAQVVGRERELCIVGASFFKHMAMLPPSNSAALMRSILHAGKQ